MNDNNVNNLTSETKKKETEKGRYRKDIFCERFRILYKANKDKYKTYEELGEVLGVTRQAVSNYYNGHTYPDILVLRGIAKTYNVSTDYLLGVSKHSTTDLELKRIAELTGLNENIIKTLMGMSGNIDGVKYYTGGKYTFPEYISTLFDTDTDEFLYELCSFSEQIDTFKRICKKYMKHNENRMLDIKKAFKDLDAAADAVELDRVRLEKEFSNLLENYYDKNQREFYKAVVKEYLRMTRSR